MSQEIKTIHVDFEKMAEACFPKEGLGVLFSCIKNEVLTLGR